MSINVLIKTAGNIYLVNWPNYIRMQHLYP